jgi:lysyl-tRNA synthetase class 2
MSDEYVIRLEKLNKIKEARINPYPSTVERGHEIKDILDHFDGWMEKGKELKIAGRIRSIRLHGGAAFVDLDDGTAKIQIHLKKDVVGSSKFDFFEKFVDTADFITVKGKLFKTKRGENTLEAKDFSLISKTLLPLPEKWHGLSDIETRFRKRYLDLIANPRVKEIFQTRSRIVKTLRDFLAKDGFVEVETPMLQPIPGGANARPFVTHHNALDTDFYLRIAPELYLKRLIIGGFNKVFEVARCFRNEGIDYLHNPEFTQIEFYWAYADYGILMKFVEKMFKNLLVNLGFTDLKIVYAGSQIDFNPPFGKMSFRDAVLKYSGIDVEKFGEAQKNELTDAARKEGAEIEDGASLGKILDEIFKTFVRPKIEQPTFIVDYPIALSPLAKRKANNPNLTERFQLLVGKGIELTNAFSELNDPLDQEERFKRQQEAREAGEEEAQRFDKDFVEALRHGMPPVAGLGIGIDRLTALLTDSHNIKEVILFPTLKPEK